MIFGFGFSRSEDRESQNRYENTLLITELLAYVNNFATAFRETGSGFAGYNTPHSGLRPHCVV
jgi:hypothetical protein